MAKHRFVSVTYGEFQSFYLYGRLTVPSARVAEFSTGPDGRPWKSKSSADGLERLLQHVPELTREDQEGVVILELAPASKRNAKGASKIRKIAIDDLEGVIPTTARARRILEPRMRAFGIELAEAHFEDRFLERWAARGVDNAVDGGRALCELLFEGDVSIRKDLEVAAREAIRALDNPAGEGKLSSAATWVPGAFRFTRHDPYDHENVNYLIDAGKALAAGRGAPTLSDPNPIEDFRAVVRDICERPAHRAMTLAELLGDERVAGVARRFGGMAEFPAGLECLVLFCRWKERFHAWREEIDAEALTALAQDARELLDGGVAFEPVAESLWLLGCFAGHERVARLRYAAARPPWYSGPSLELAKIPRRAKPPASSGPETQSTDAPEAAPATTGDGDGADTAVSGELPFADESS